MNLVNAAVNKNKQNTRNHFFHPYVKNKGVLVNYFHIHITQQGNRGLHFARAVHSPHPLPPIGEAAYRQHAEGGPSHGHRQHAQKIW